MISLYSFCFFIQICVPYKPGFLYIAWLLKIWFSQIFSLVQKFNRLFLRNNRLFSLCQHWENLFLIFELWFVILFNSVMFVVNNVLITSLNTKYLCNKCSLWIRFLLILEIKTAFKVWSNQHVIFCTFCYDWHKLLYSSDLILFSFLKTTHIIPTLTKGLCYICDAISCCFHTNNLLFLFFPLL